jgi:hypothetical protein
MNAASCVLFGSIFALLPVSVATFLGGGLPAPQLLLIILGVALIVNGFHLLQASSIELPKKELVLYFSAGDFLWVIASLCLVFSKIWITTSQGVLATLLVALMVGYFGILQMVKRKAMGDC